MKKRKYDMVIWIYIYKKISSILHKIKKFNIFQIIRVRGRASMGYRGLVPLYHTLRHFPFPPGPVVQEKELLRPCSCKRRFAPTFELP